MRGAVLRVGAALREQVGFRGAFTIDGVLTRDGFRPTELNARFGAALMGMCAGLEFPLYLLHLMIVQGIELGFDPAELERCILEHVAANPSGGALAVFPTPFEESQTHILERTPQGWEDSGPDEPWTARAILGPHPAGGIAIVRLNAERIEVGRSIAPLVADILEHLDRRFLLGIGPLEPARDVRTPGSSI